MSSTSNPNQGTSNQTIKEDLIERSKVFIPYYTEKCEEKLKTYLKQLEPREKLKATENFEKICDNVPISAVLKNPIKTVGGKFVNNFTNSKEKINKRIKFFNKIKKDDLRKMFVEAGGYIFWSYQNQFKDVTDIHGNVTVGMQKLAIDAVDRTFDFIENCKSKNLESCFINIAISAFFGTSKTFKGLKKGDTIKYKDRECQTASLYENVSIIKEDIFESKVQYKKSITKHEEYGYRLASSEEACHLSKYKRCEWNVVDTRENETLTIDDMKSHLDDILNRINIGDTLYLQQTTFENISGGNADTTYIRDLLNRIFNKLENIKYIFLLLAIIIVMLLFGYFKYSNPDPIQKDLTKSIWFDTREPVKYFTGRVEILKRLHNALQKNKKEQVALSQTAVITGLGGIGKTELARKYIYDYKTNYTNVLWIKSETQKIFKESFHKVAIELNISITESIKIVDRVKSIKRERERDLTSIIKDVYVYFNNTKTLIIFDNVDKLDDIKQFLDLSLPPNISKPFLLITSRNQEWDVGEEGTIEIIKLNEFTQEESHDVIRKSLLDVNSTNEEVNQLSEELQNFPLALNQATSYINMMNKQLTLQGKQRFGITDYLSLYHDNKSKLLKFKPNIGYERYFDTVYSTWMVTLQKIEENENALNIIQFMAYLKPDSIDVDLCFSNYFENKDDMWRAVELLHQYSMINIVNGTASIHRLVQEVIKIKLKDENKQEEVLSKALDILSPLENDSIDLQKPPYLWNFYINDERNTFQYYFKYLIGKVKRIPFYLLQCGNILTLNYLLTYEEFQDILKMLTKDDRCRSKLEILNMIALYIMCYVFILYLLISDVFKNYFFLKILCSVIIICISILLKFKFNSIILQIENVCSLISFVPSFLF